ncbi:tRNA (adenosine(37)-N6)-dimethylallyltransferase MiaA [Limoniibacter endophyticus]|uniref:tRNA dimethylallyltransferase n=1 Tax=Limoniibacter endophyticus TaxID=1565040 RepID=A0A8J3DR07_9HYPH|nr:tRNA (adenosine(37)-N6)-dimethylallyltransferase MiaA [Limoniibacter endophyticus]GHC75386.1 tRNA dimethylallyltransferase [Limoniibacter endophyticus]
MTEPRQGAEVAPIKNAILIAGPTASGKSALALSLAQKCKGAIINTDSMQVYAILDALTARPPQDDLTKAPHHLYGHIDPATHYSTGAWLEDVRGLAASGALEDKRPIFVGGTGLYFKALLEGISPMPVVAADVREMWRAALRERGAQALHAELAERDSEMAIALKPSDGQRIVRALEVLDSTGISLRVWQKKNGEPLVETTTVTRIVLEPDREKLREWIGNRFVKMIEAGAMEEVRALAATKLDPAMPAMKAIGVRELMRADAGEITLSQASERATILTRQYAKRQMTWFRNQCDESWSRIRVEDQEDLRDFANILDM